MFGPNCNKNQPLSLFQNIKEQQIRNTMHQLTQEIRLLQSQITAELELNRYLLVRAKQMRNNSERADFAPPEFDFYRKVQSPSQEIQAIVKIQSNSSSENHQKKQIDQSIKTAIKMDENQEGQQELMSRTKPWLHSRLKQQQNLQPCSVQHQEKNETKNIPKNYGKAILSFIQKNIQKYLNVVHPILHKYKLTVSDLLNHIKKHKKQVNSIHYLKVMWGFQDFNDPIFKCIRILSYTFMRKYCLSYIFNSRVKNYNTHIKYRKRMLEGIEKPADFTCIKQF